MNILITGATGFVGRNLVTYLSKNTKHKIIVIVRDLEVSKSLFPSENVYHILNTKLDDIKQYSPQCVFHLAAKLSSQNDENTLDELLSSNIIFGTKLLHVLKECDSLKLFINIGTFAEYRFGPNGVNNAYLYSATKTAFKELLRYYSDISEYKYLHIVPYTIYGGRDSSKKIIDYIKDSLELKEPVKMTKGEQVLDFIHINDVISFFIFIIDNIDRFLSLSNGEIVHLGSGQGTSIKDLAKMIENKYAGKANINWGGIPYRDRDIMYAVAPIHKLLQLGWKSQYKLKDNL